jgi:predicted exporter
LESITLAILYRPDGESMPLVLASVNDPTMLMHAVCHAISEADSRAATESNILTQRGYQEKAKCLRQLIGSSADELATVVM